MSKDYMRIIKTFDLVFSIQNHFKRWKGNGKNFHIGLQLRDDNKMTLKMLINGYKQWLLQ